MNVLSTLIAREKIILKGKFCIFLEIMKQREQFKLLICTLKRHIGKKQGNPYSGRGDNKPNNRI